MRLGLLLGLAPGAALGVGRFAYALVLPAMQADLNLSFAQAGVLGSANTAGYLLGALFSHRLLAAVGYRRGFYASLLLQTFTLLALVVAPSYPSVLLLRSLQGVLGAFVFVGGAALLMASSARPLALGLYFGGVGTGLLASPLVLPLFSDWREGWALLGLLSLVLSLASFAALPGLHEPGPPARGTERSLRPITAALIAYGLYGAGYIGYMTFVTTGLTVPLAPFWAVLGAGALGTGLVWGPVVGRLQGLRSLRLVLAVLLAASLQPVLQGAPYLSAFLFGISFLGVITAITALFQERLPVAGWSRAMGLSTASFALGQAIGPSVAGVAGDLSGSATGALGAASLLLLLAWAAAWWPQGGGSPRGSVDGPTARSDR